MTTFAELQTQIRSYTETSSDVLTDTVVNDFILQGELRIFREVDLDCFRSYQFTTLSIGNEFIVLPGDTPSTMSFVRTASIYATTGTTANIRDYLIQKDIPMHVWQDSDKSNKPRMVICTKSQLPSTRTWRNSWKIKEDCINTNNIEEAA